MQHEFAPWRKEYFKNKQQGCAFCNIINEKNDDENFVLFRSKHCFGVMNRYPYTLGEFMIIPYLHTDNIENLDDEIWQEINKFVKIGVKIIKETLGANGINIGMNLGCAAGAGIAEHIHYHIVPRFNKDTNFMTTIAHTRVHGVPFIEQFLAIKQAFKRYFDDSFVLSK